MKTPELNKYHGFSVHIADGKDRIARLDTRLSKDRPCLTFPKLGKWEDVQPYYLTDADIEALVFDEDSHIIRSPKLPLVC